VFKRLYGHVREMGELDPAIAGFRLYVEKDNTAAQRTYADQGLQPTHYLMFEDLK
jgi:ribosomal protein S18 acetylase RimI-like enzyme